MYISKGVFISFTQFVFFYKKNLKLTRQNIEADSVENLFLGISKGFKVLEQPFQYILG